MRLRPRISLHEATVYLKDQLQQVAIALQKVHGPGALDHYLDWVDRLSRELPDRFGDHGLVEMLHTPHYWYIRNFRDSHGLPAEYRLDTPTAYLIVHELTAHAERLQETLDHLQLVEHIASRFGQPVVLDTNVFINFDPLSEHIPYERWLAITGCRPPAEFHVVIPALVIDEIDRLAHTGDRKLNIKARTALGTLDPFVDVLRYRGRLPVRDDARWMTVEILPDAPSHRRQADNDVELLDRAQFLSQITNQPVMVVTADRGMRIRGMVGQILPAGSGVNVVTMPEDLRVNEQPDGLPPKVRRAAPTGP
jgi:hypothetical protein